ncbi:hypothetical protein [Nonomuraea basaltis]|uniref:hypothetical protein n=1 Tax=Nonomuraea basaltis TaxID=2495887 RepID=UPI00110C5CF4|nr:hypothetical protein [Nonomuraea basaltis]TMR88609.1 hypothetical protein EJK15_65285 [Nonomuraea basaltis]
MIAIIGVRTLSEVVPLWVLIVLGGLSLGMVVFVVVRSARRTTSRIEAADVMDPGDLLRERIRQVNKAFTEAAKLMDDLRRELEAQQTAREGLIAQAEEQQRLLAIDQAQAENIRQILVGETKATIQEERRQQWKFFALGIAASIPIGVLINVLVP